MWKHLIRALLIVILLIGIVVILVGCAIAVPKFDKSKLEIHPQATTILDQNNQVVMKVNTAASDYVSFDQISDNMKHAIVATEDNRFYQHSGIDFRGIARAIFVDITHGGKQQGASTITQQLAKMVYLNQGKTFTRKFTEAIYAAQIEHNFSKDEILEKYLNTVYLGDSQTGVEDAAKAYFGVDAKDLNLQQAALLAGLPQAPSYYDPYVNPDQALQRRNTVLDLMNKYGYITDAQKTTAQAQPLGIRPASSKSNTTNDDIQYPFYLDLVYQEAENKGNMKPEDIYQGGLTIYTNLNTKIQAQAEQAYQNNSNFPQGKSDQMVQSGAVFVDPHTGGILGVVGNRGQHVQQGFSYATQSQRSPGSSIKPLVDYGPAIDLGLLGANDRLVDKPMTFGNGYSPRDWDSWSQHAPGTVSVRDALRFSWNVPAVWTMDHILGGPDKGIAFAKRMGLPFDNSDYNLSVAIGGMKTGFSPLQMAQAYSAFDNNGTMIPAHAINKIVSSSGEVLYQFNESSVQVMKQSTAATMTDLMTSVVNYSDSTGYRARIPGFPVAGKTGTSEYGNTGGDRDAWFVGYTPNVVGAIWMGYPTTDDNHYMTHESGLPAALFSTILTPALQGTDPGTFAGMPSSAQQPVQQPDKSTTNASIVAQGKWDPQTRTVTLTWNDVQQAGVKYTVFRKGFDQPLGAVARPGFIDTAAPVNQNLQYIVVATVGNTNIQSNVVNVATSVQQTGADQTGGGLNSQAGSGSTDTGQQAGNNGTSTNPPNSGLSGQPTNQGQTGGNTSGTTNGDTTNPNNSGNTGTNQQVQGNSGQSPQPSIPSANGNKKP